MGSLERREHLFGVRRWLAGRASRRDQLPLPFENAAALLQTMLGHGAVVD
jgi:hypothetical protein